MPGVKLLSHSELSAGTGSVEDVHVEADVIRDNGIARVGTFGLFRSLVPDGYAADTAKFLEEHFRSRILSFGNAVLHLDRIKLPLALVDARLYRRRVDEDADRRILFGGLLLCMESASSGGVHEVACHKGGDGTLVYDRRDSMVERVSENQHTNLPAREVTRAIGATALEPFEAGLWTTLYPGGRLLFSTGVLTVENEEGEQILSRQLSDSSVSIDQIAQTAIGLEPNDRAKGVFVLQYSS